jgi:hypothetical protein
MEVLMRKLPFGLLALLAAAPPAVAQDADRIGTTASASSDVQGRRGAVQRGLKVGDSVYREEEIRTGQAAKAQLLFRDETVFSIGPNSVVVLDKFVFDPDKKTGEMAVKAVTGAFRFVSGSAPKDKYRIETPAGSIGVRGTALTFSITGSTLTLRLDHGSAELCTGGTCVKLTQPGTYVVSTGGTTTTPQKVGDAACGTTTCRDNPTDTPPLVNTFISDVLNQQIQSGRTSLGPDHPPRGHGFFGPPPP